MVTKNLTPNQKAWKKEQKRLQQFISRAENRGYIFPADVIPETPKRITKKQLSKIKGLNPQTLYEQAEFYNPETGETISGVEGRKFERKRSAKKAQLTKAIKQAQNTKNYLPKKTYLVLQHVRDLIKQFTPPRHWSSYWLQQKLEDKNKLETLLETTVIEEGEDIVAERLENYAGDIDRIVNSILYGSDEDQVHFDLVEFATIIKGRSLTQEESSELTDLMEMQETE